MAQKSLNMEKIKVEFNKMVIIASNIYCMITFFVLAKIKDVKKYLPVK